MPEEREERDRNQKDDDAVWEQLIASFDAAPLNGEVPWPDAEKLDEDDEPGEDGDGDGRGRRSGDAGGLGDEDGADDEDEDGDEPPAHGARGGDDGPNTTRSILVATGPVHWPRELGPRDHEEPEDEDEGHYVPPPPPPLPKVDVTTKFAWIAALGGPLLLLAMVLAQQEITWWMSVLGIGGFLGGFTTLVVRMKDRGEDDEDDPTGGAVV